MNIQNANKAFNSKICFTLFHTPILHSGKFILNCKIFVTAVVTLDSQFLQTHTNFEEFFLFCNHKTKFRLCIEKYYNTKRYNI